jgi:hypothetical protein
LPALSVSFQKPGFKDSFSNSFNFFSFSSMSKTVHQMTDFNL